MIKVFCKKTPPKKVFFDKKMQVRSLAYGQKVLRDVVEWENYFLERKRAYKGAFVLFAQNDIFGCGFAEREVKAKIDEEISVLPPLEYEGLRFTVKKDGYVYVNEKKSVLHLGAELKSWAIFSVPTKAGVETALFVVNKPHEEGGEQLSVYEMNKYGVENKMRCFVPLEYSPEPSSGLVIFGQHVFLVHNSKLDYFHFLPECNELERVAIGGDGDNAEAAWCQYVNPTLVINGRGGVFWQADKEVYGFTIGYPRRLVKMPCKSSDTIVHLRAGTKSVYIYTRDKNLGTYACVRYRLADNGQYEGRMVPVETKLSAGARIR